MKNCVKCGKEYDEDMTWCPYCGYEENADMVSQKNIEEENDKGQSVEENESENIAPAEDMEQSDMMAALAAAKAAGAAQLQQKQEVMNAQEENEELPKSKLKVAIAITIIVGLLVIAGVIVAIWYVSQQSGKVAMKPVENYMEGYVNKDVQGILNSYPDFMRNALTESSSAEDIWKSLDESFVAAFGDDWKATYELGEAEEMQSKEVSNLASYLSECYNTTVTLSEGYWVNADMTLSGSNNKETLNLRLAVSKIGGQWYVVYETTASQNSTSTDSSSAAQ